MTWRGWRMSEERRVDAAASRLLADTEAFLSGEYLDHQPRHAHGVPEWARINGLAHRNLERLRQAQLPSEAGYGAAVAEHLGRSRNFAEACDSADLEVLWDVAQQILTNELLQLVDDDSNLLARVQRLVLVPLELQLMRNDRKFALTALEFVALTRAALRWGA